jgi:hypothetical protein
MPTATPPNKQPKYEDLGPADGFEDLGAAGGNPDTSSADAVRTKPGPQRFNEAAVSRLPSIEGISAAVASPRKTLRNITGADAYEEGGQMIRDGNIGEGFKHIWKGSPFYRIPAELASAVGEKIGEEDYAGAAGVATGETVNALLGAGGGRAAGELVESPTLALGRNMQQNAHMPRKLLRDKPNLDTVIDRSAREWIAPTQGGAAKAHGLANDAVAKIDDLAMNTHAADRVPMDAVDAAATVKGNPGYEKSLDSGTKSQMKGMQDMERSVKFDFADPAEIQKVKDFMANQINATNVHKSLTQPGFTMPTPLTAADIPDVAVKGLKYPSTMTVKDMMELKRVTRDTYTSSQGQLLVNNVVDAMAKDVAVAANETLIQAFPELKQLGIEARDLIDMEKMAKESAARNHTLTGIPGAGVPHTLMTQGASAAGFYGVLAALFKSATLKSRVASTLYKVSDGAVAGSDVLARLAAIEAEYEKVNRKEQKDAQAANAKP